MLVNYDVLKANAEHQRALNAIRFASMVTSTYVFKRVLLAERGSRARHHSARLRASGSNGGLGGEAEGVHREGG